MSLRSKARLEFDKYDLYRQAVQQPEATVDFLIWAYRDIRGTRSPAILREDFSGTFANCEAWVKRSSQNQAIAIDTDENPLRYGIQRSLETLTQNQASRLYTLCRDVRAKNLPTADVICALNFSYGVFQDRPTLKAYLRKCLADLKANGVVILDCLGGMESASEAISVTECDGFSYTWEQRSFDPLSRQAIFAIHFQRDGEALRRDQFVYDWRMWTPVELRDLMLEIGYSEVFFYQQGESTDGAWVAYVVGAK